MTDLLIGADSCMVEISTQTKEQENEHTEE